MTEDAALHLVDERFRDIGARMPCMLEEIREAFTYLTSPLVAAAIRSTENGSGIVITRAR